MGGVGRGHGRKCGVLERRQKLRNFYLNMLIQAEPLSWPIRQSHCSCKDSHIERMFAQHVPPNPSPPPTPALLTHFISAATLAILRYLFSISKANSQLISIHLVAPDCLRLEHFSLIWISKSTFSNEEVSNVIKDRELFHFPGSLSCLKCNRVVEGAGYTSLNNLLCLRLHKHNFRSLLSW